MRDSKQKLIYLLWTVIAVLLIGGVLIAILLMGKANELRDTNHELTGNNASLREQLRQAKASPTPSPTPEPDYIATPSSTPRASTTPSPTPSSSSNR